MVASTLLSEIEIKPHSTIMVIGRRSEGKSFLSKWLLKHMVETGIYDSVYLLSTTEKYSHSFNCLPPSHIVEGYDMKFIEKILDSQKAMIEKHGKDSELVSSVLIILDDLLSTIQTGSLEMSQINRIFSTSRHLNTGILVISQTSRSLCSPTCRQNLDLLFFRKVNQTFISSIYESVYWKGNLKSFTEFVNRSLENTDHEFICYNNSQRDESKAFSLVKAAECDFMIEYGSHKKSSNKKDSNKKLNKSIEDKKNKIK